MSVAETPRLRLREVTLDDAAFLCRLLNEPSWLQNIGDRGVRTPADAAGYIRSRVLASYAAHGYGMYLIETKDAARLAGVCGLFKRDTLPHADLGCALLPEFWGQGLAREAAGAVMQFASTRRLGRVLAIANPDNARSIRLLERLGFRLEGTYRAPTENKDLRLYGADA